MPTRNIARPSQRCPATYCRWQAAPRRRRTPNTRETVIRCCEKSRARGDMTRVDRAKAQLWRAAHDIRAQSARDPDRLGPSLELPTAAVRPHDLRFDPARELRRRPFGPPIEPGGQPLLRESTAGRIRRGSADRRDRRPVARARDRARATRYRAHRRRRGGAEPDVSPSNTDANLAAVELVVAAVPLLPPGMP